jgi:hypothetical protein
VSEGNVLSITSNKRELFNAVIAAITVVASFASFTVENICAVQVLRPRESEVVSTTSLRYSVYSSTPTARNAPVLAWDSKILNYVQKQFQTCYCDAFKKFLHVHCQESCCQPSPIELLKTPNNKLTISICPIKSKLSNGKHTKSSMKKSDLTLWYVVFEVASALHILEPFHVFCDYINTK